MTTLKIMSYNIHSGIGLDDIVDYTRMAECIGKYAPDVVGFQEVAQDHPRSKGIFPLDFMGNILEMKGEFGKTIHVSRPGTDYDYGIGFLSRFEYEHITKLALPNIDNLEPRVAQFAKIKAPVEFIFVNTHLGIKSEHTDPERVFRMRFDQLAAINGELDKILAGKDIPCVITGDFNARPGSECIDLLEKTWNVTDLEHFTFPANRPDRKIDYIATRGNVKMRSYAVLDEKVVSDHAPIIAELDFE